MTMAEFLSLAEEYGLPVEDPERFRFMIRDMSAAEFRAHLDKKDAPIWRFEDDEEDGGKTAGDLTDGCGNRWVRARKDAD
jgi:hypothetical protein